MNYKYNDIIKNLDNNKYYCYFFENSKQQREIMVLLPNNNTCIIAFDKNNDEINYIKFIKNNELSKHKELINILNPKSNNDVKKDIIGLFNSELDNDYSNINEEYSKAYNLSSVEYLKNTFIPVKKISAKYVINKNKQQNVFIKTYDNKIMELNYDDDGNVINLSLYNKNYSDININELYSNDISLTKISINSLYNLSSEEISIILYELFFKK